MAKYQAEPGEEARAKHNPFKNRKSTKAKPKAKGAKEAAPFDAKSFFKKAS